QKYVIASAYAGDTRAALAELERRLSKLVAQLGGDDRPAMWMHRYFAMVLQLEGDYAGAVAHYRRARAQQDPDRQAAWLNVYETELARLAGAVTDRELLDAVHAITGLGTTP